MNGQFGTCHEAAACAGAWSIPSYSPTEPDPHRDLSDQVAMVKQVIIRRVG